jgi:hypothetical protein
MWFVGNGAARGESIEREPWLVHLVWQLLVGDESPKSLFSRNPFEEVPPKWIRADIWQYAFTRDRTQGAWWTRKRVGEFLRPVSVENERLRDYARSFGWSEGGL